MLIALYLDGRLLLDEMVSRIYEVADVQQAVDDVHAGALNRGVLAIAEG